MKLGYSLALASVIAINSLATWTYHVDSAAAALGDGSKATPYKYPSDVPTLNAGESVAFKRGSVWRGYEGFNNNADRLRFGAYGEGAKPILDGSKQAANGSFTKTGGRTNIYQITVSMSATGGKWINWIVNGVQWLAADDLTDLDSKPNNYYIADHDATSVVIYFNPGGNPTADGKEYRYSACDYGFTIPGTGCVVENIECGRHALNVSVGLGKFGRAVNVSFFDGGRHSMIADAGSVVTGCSFDNIYWKPYYGVGFIVFFGNEFDGESCAIINTTFSNDFYLRSGVAIDSHHGTSGNLARIDILGCTFTKCDSAIGCQNYDFLSVRSCTFNDCVVNFAPAGAAGSTAEIKFCSSTSVETSGSAAYVVPVNNGATIIVEDNTGTYARMRSFIRANEATGVIVSASRNTISAGAFDGYPLEIVRMKDGELSLYDNDLGDANGQFACNLGFDGGTVVYEGDRNTWRPGASLTFLKSDIAGGSASGLADWKTKSGQDQNSIAA